MGSQVPYPKGSQSVLCYPVCKRRGSAVTDEVIEGRQVLLLELAGRPNTQTLKDEPLVRTP